MIYFGLVPSEVEPRTRGPGGGGLVLWADILCIEVMKTPVGKGAEIWRD